MQNAEVVLGVLRERGRRGLPLNELYRQLFNPQLYLLAYGRIYANHGAMTPGVTQETADGMTLAKIGAIIAAMRHERYRFAPVRRTLIPKTNGKLRPAGLPHRPARGGRGLDRDHLVYRGRPLRLFRVARSRHHGQDPGGKDPR